MSPNNPRELENKWDDGLAASMSEPELLQYRSNLLGSDLRITNYGGGNTSAKVDKAEVDKAVPAPLNKRPGRGRHRTLPAWMTKKTDSPAVVS